MVFKGSLQDEIRTLYREIKDWNGDFGDPVVDSFSFNPWDTIEEIGLPDFERRGAIVAVLVLVMTMIDVSTYEDARSSDIGQRALELLENETVKQHPDLRQALESFAKSKDAYHQALQKIYHNWILPNV